MRYAAPRDRTVRLVTALVGLVLALGAATLLVLSVREDALPFGAAAAGALALAVGLAWALAPRGFSLEGGALRVERALRPVVIPLAEVRAVSALPDGAIRGALRLGGSGGLFGLYGRYWTRALGSFRLYASRREGLVRVDTAAERFVLSPEPPDAFVADVLARAPRAREGAAAPVARRPLGRGPRAAIAAALLAVPVLVGGVLAASWAWAPRGARVTADAIVVDRRWAGPEEIPLAEVRGAMLLPPGALRGAERRRGVGLGDVAYGRFRSRDLGAFQLYAWRRGTAVLIATRGDRIVLTPEQPDRFVDEVNAALVRAR